jgi:hypothetical protein
MLATLSFLTRRTNNNPGPGQLILVWALSLLGPLAEMPWKESTKSWLLRHDSLSETSKTNLAESLSEELRPVIIADFG